MNARKTLTLATLLIALLLKINYLSAQSNDTSLVKKDTLTEQTTSSIDTAKALKKESS